VIREDVELTKESRAESDTSGMEASRTRGADLV
jgi:hypothetical protein